ELEEIAARKAQAKAPKKEDTTLFMGELEQGLDENAE
ncbi:MAG: 2-oxoglutarate:ferredoxin oxidoreductase, partial [Nitrospina sp.]|nr:2-oxoglutarate:ferredoxin oxidoreductase [Nitrospina sp.]